MNILQKYRDFNIWLANFLTDILGTMECAYVFVVLAILDLPAALVPGGLGFWGWISTIFIQLVMLAIIMFAQKINGARESAKIAAQSEEQHKQLLEILLLTQKENEDIGRSIDLLTKSLDNQGDEITDLKEILTILRKKVK